MIFPRVRGLIFPGGLFQPPATMKNILLAALVLFSAVSFSSAEDGWISMFNGKDLSGWKSNTETEKRPADVF